MFLDTHTHASFINWIHSSLSLFGSDELTNCNRCVKIPIPFTRAAAAAAAAFSNGQGTLGALVWSMGRGSCGSWVSASGVGAGTHLNFMLIATK